MRRRAVYARVADGLTLSASGCKPALPLMAALLMAAGSAGLAGPVRPRGGRTAPAARRDQAARSVRRARASRGGGLHSQRPRASRGMGRRTRAPPRSQAVAVARAEREPVHARAGPRGCYPTHAAVAIRSRCSSGRRPVFLRRPCMLRLARPTAASANFARMREAVTDVNPQATISARKPRAHEHHDDRLWQFGLAMASCTW